LFSFFNRSPKEPFPFDQLKTDFHSHILPGIDDGSPDTDTSITLIKGLIELGYENLVGTPHVMEDIWKNDDRSILRSHTLLNTSLREAGINNDIRPAAEYLVDGNFENLLRNKEKLLTIKDNWVLIEVSFIAPPPQLREVIFEMQLQGYQPVFAHPERYNFYHHRKNALEEIRNAGCLLQCNLLSFAGYYGPNVLKAAESMATNEVVDLLGTDLHHQRHLEALQQLKRSKALGLAMDCVLKRDKS
jgi:tyrosine-protein phosphatase YwqE